MPWLVRGDQVLSSLRVADSPGTRTRGLMGRDGLEGAILLRPARSVHTLGVRFPIDVAYLDDNLTVLRTTRMEGLRVGRPVRRACSVLEAEAGSFERWGLIVGDVLEVRE